MLHIFIQKYILTVSQIIKISESNLLKIINIVSKNVKNVFSTELVEECLKVLSRTDELFCKFVYAFNNCFLSISIYAFKAYS